MAKKNNDVNLGGIDGDVWEVVQRGIEDECIALGQHGYSENEAHDMIYGPKTLIKNAGAWEIRGLPVNVADEHSDDPDLGYTVDGRRWKLPYVTDWQMKAIIAAGKFAADGNNRWKIPNNANFYDILTVNEMMEGLAEERDAIQKMNRTTDPDKLQDLHFEWDERIKGFDARLNDVLTLGLSYQDSLRLGVPIPMDRFSMLNPQGYVVIARDPLSSEAIIMRSSVESYQPYVHVSGYDETTGTWAQGDYFSDLYDALASKDSDLPPRENLKDSELALAVLADLSQSDDSTVRQAVANNPNTPARILADLAHDEDSFVRINVARNTSASPETLIELAQDEDKRVRYCVADNSSTPEDAAYELMRDTDSLVRESVAANPTVPFDVLYTLAEDEDEFVRRCAARTLEARHNQSQSPTSRAEAARAEASKLSSTSESGHTRSLSR